MALIEVETPLAPWPVTTRERLAAVVEAYEKVEEFTFDVETWAVHRDHRGDPRRNDVFWIALATYGRLDVIPLGHPKGRMVLPERKDKILPPPSMRKRLKNGELSNARRLSTLPATFTAPPAQLMPSEVFPALRPLFFSERRKVNHNVKFDVESLAKYYDGEVMPGPFGDTMIAQHIVDETLMAYDLGALVKRHFSYSYEKLGKKGVETVPFIKAARYNGLDARLTWLLWRKLVPLIEAEGLTGVLDLEMRLLETLIHLEMTGVAVDEKAMAELGVQLGKRIRGIEDTMYGIAGGNEWDLASNQQKGEFIYKTLGHKVRYRTEKTKQPSTRAEHLEEYAEVDPVVRELLDWAEYQKVKSTYVDGLLPRMYRGRLHPILHQHRTKTGRLSCAEPNLQNIPRDTDVRKLFVAPPGYELVVADYDQIELRVIAYFSECPVLASTFQHGLDIHAAAAAGAFGVSLGQVTKEQRASGKTLNFAMSYGAGPQKLTEQGISLERAKEIFDAFRKRYSAVYRWKRWVIAEAAERRPPYVTTLSGRRRRVPELFWRDTDPETQRKIRARAERQLVNARVQGSAADLLKVAMIRLHKKFQDTPWRMALQVHDELLCLAPAGTGEECKQMVTDVMSSVRYLGSIPIVVSAGIGERWSEAKS